MTKQLFCALACALAFGACGGGSGGGSGDGHEHSSGGEHHDEHEEHDLSAFQGPVSGDAAAGATVFATFCEGCHPGGGEGIGDDLHTSGDSPAEARWIVRNGEERMPGFQADTISDEDLENLLAHLQTYGMFQ